MSRLSRSADLRRLARENQRIADDISAEVKRAPAKRPAKPKRVGVRCERYLDGEAGVPLTPADITGWLTTVPSHADLYPIMTYGENDYRGTYSQPERFSGLRAVWTEDR